MAMASTVLTNDNQVWALVTIMNLETDITRFLLDHAHAADMGARRRLALELRRAAEELETVTL
jgi:hypothetical protein